MRSTAIIFTLLLSLIAFSISSGQQLPTVYEYFTGDGITSGLTADTPGFFKLNGKDLRIMSGALHYFRVHPSLWRDRLRKFRAAGLNTVETYVAWNLHEPLKNVFDFGNSTTKTEWSGFADLRKFLQIAQEEDLLVLFRPGPYICTEWEFGGFPSWLLRDPNMKVRTSYQPFLDRVKIYFDKLLPLVADLQFTRGGPIIAVQIENEYGFFNPKDKAYLEFLKVVIDENGIDSLLFTSDGASSGTSGSLPGTGVLLTLNFNNDIEYNFGTLKELQPNRPMMSMEYYSGWIDHWFEDHHVVSAEQYTGNLDIIFSEMYNGSANVYMFHGGTNFGFFAGANNDGNVRYGYHSDTTSYDYNATLSEAGDYSEKFMNTIELSEKYGVPQLSRPQMPPESVKTTYPSIIPTKYLTYEELKAQIPHKFNMDIPVSMELLDMNEGNGQSYGYISYKTVANFGNGSILKVGQVHDFGMLLIDGKIHSTPLDLDGYWIKSEAEITLSVETSGDHTIELLIENMGRVNFGSENDFLQWKGLPNGLVELDGAQLNGFEVTPFEFKSEWVSSLKNWKEVESISNIPAPAIFHATFEISEDKTIGDTFIEMSDWHKGILFVNGFNLGRYFQPAGPQKTLYLPAPVLKYGTNTVIAFEQLDVGSEIHFRDVHIINA